MNDIDCKSCDEGRVVTEEDLRLGDEKLMLGLKEIVAKRKKDYKKPEFKKEEQMNFPLEIINFKGQKIVCRQCSSCHGCR